MAIASWRLWRKLRATIKKIMKQLFENELKVGDNVIYNGSGTDRKATIIKRTKRTITMKCSSSTLKLTFISRVPAEDLGLRRDI